MDKRIKIMTIGSAMYDIFLEYTCKDLLTLHSTPESHSFLLLEVGKKRELQDIACHTGGGATNSAVSFARLGFDVSSFFKIGNDAAGKTITDELVNNNIHIDYILTTDKAPTGTSFVIPCPTGDRSTLMHRGANVTLTQKELPLASIAAHDYLYITSLSGATSQFIEPITAEAKKQNKSVAVNPGTSQLVAGAQHLRNALPYIDILILNSYEASLLMYELIPQVHTIQTDIIQNIHSPRLLQMSMDNSQPLDIRTFFKEILACGPRILVVTNGQEGVYVAHAQANKIYFHPSLPTEVISTLGAGDAFGSCFVAQIAHNKPLEYAIRAGIANASSVIQHTDTKTGLLSTQELEKRIQNIDDKLLQIFDL